MHRHSEETGSQYALAEIDELLKVYDLNLRKLKLAIRNISSAILNLNCYDILEDQTKASAYTEKLTDEQRMAVETVLDAIYESERGRPKCFFLDGHAGTRKSLCMKH